MMEEQENNLHKNVILDLLPVYLAGEGSDETCQIIEEYAREHPDIAQLIQEGIPEPEEIAARIPAPDDLEMKTIKRLRTRIRRQLVFVVLITVSLLLIPFIAMWFTDEVNWTVSDFVVMGCILMGTGLTYIFISGRSSNRTYKFAVGIAILAGFLLAWSNLAVGIIGSGANLYNMLYLGVFVVGIAGAWISRFRQRGMAITMLLAALVQMLIPVIALIANRPVMEEAPGIAGVFMINLFFAVLFSMSAFLFRISGMGKRY